MGLIHEGAGTRTLDLRIKSPLLYQLSYAFFGFGDVFTMGKSRVAILVVELLIGQSRLGLGDEW